MDQNLEDSVNIQNANPQLDIVQDTYGYINLDRFGLASRKLNDVNLAISSENPKNIHPIISYKLNSKFLEVIFKDRKTRDTAVDQGYTLFSQLIQVELPRPKKYHRTIYLYGIHPAETNGNVKTFLETKLHLEVMSEFRMLTSPGTEIQNGGRSVVVSHDPSVTVPDFAMFSSTLHTHPSKISLWYPNMPKTCRNCHEIGHLSKNCQMPKFVVHAGAKSYASAVQDISHERADSVEQNSENINFVDMEPLANCFQKVGTSISTNNQLSLTEDQFIPFFTKGDIFSNFYDCSFQIDGQMYNSTEQFLFNQKAVFVGDMESATKILKNRDARNCKLIGEKNVKWSGSLGEWRDFALEKLRIANVAKYSQNEHLRKHLFATSPKILVETNPHDSFWGIGLKKTDANVQNQQNWKGANKMGYLLTEIRNELLKNPKLAIVDRKRSLDSPESVSRKRLSVSSI